MFQKIQLNKFSNFFENWKKKRNKPQLGKFHTLIGPGATVDGNVKIEDGQTIQIDGKINGSVNVSGLKSTIVITINGTVFGANAEEAALQADHIVINGTVTGKKILARETLSIGHGAKLNVEKIIYGGTLDVQRGALITGYIRDGDEV